jgi:hypothetical protein
MTLAIAWGCLCWGLVQLITKIMSVPSTQQSKRVSCSRTISALDLGVDSTSEDLAGAVIEKENYRNELIAKYEINF